MDPPAEHSPDTGDTTQNEVVCRDDDGFLPFTIHKRPKEDDEQTEQIKMVYVDEDGHEFEHFDDDQFVEVDDDNFDVDDGMGDDDGFEDDVEFKDEDFGDDDDDGWGDDVELVFDDQKIDIENREEEDCQAILERALEKRRRAKAKLENFWKCGKCQFLNHPSRAVCMTCTMPQLDVVHHIMSCPEGDLKVCPQCKSFIVPFQFDDHVLDCQPIGALDNEQTNQSWYAKLTPCERKAINHVNALAITQSNQQHRDKLLSMISTMENGKYADSAEETLAALHQFLEWDCPIIIKVHINKVMEYLLRTLIIAICLKLERDQVEMTRECAEKQRPPCSVTFMIKQRRLSDRNMAV